MDYVVVVMHTMLLWNSITECECKMFELFILIN